MKTILTAIALTIALPAMAHPTAATSAPKAADHANMKGMMDCKGMAGHMAGSGQDMAAMKNHDMANMKGQEMAGMKGQEMAGMKGQEMANMKGHEMAGMTKQDHEKMMLACGKEPAKGAPTPSTVQPPHKM